MLGHLVKLTRSSAFRKPLQTPSRYLSTQGFDDMKKFIDSIDVEQLRKTISTMENARDGNASIAEMQKIINSLPEEFRSPQKLAGIMDGMMGHLRSTRSFDSKFLLNLLQASSQTRIPWTGLMSNVKNHIILVAQEAIPKETDIKPLNDILLGFLRMNVPLKEFGSSVSDHLVEKCLIAFRYQERFNSFYCLSKISFTASNLTPEQYSKVVQKLSRSVGDYDDLPFEKTVALFYGVGKFGIPFRLLNPPAQNIVEDLLFKQIDELKEEELSRLLVCMRKMDISLGDISNLHSEHLTDKLKSIDKSNFLDILSLSPLPTTMELIKKIEEQIEQNTSLFY